MSDRDKYEIRTDVQFGPMELVDLKGLADGCTKEWFNQSLCRVNDCVVRVGIVQGEFHWHKHDEEDEFFYVIEGRWLVDLEDKTVELLPGQGLMVPKGVLHKTRAPVRTVVMMIEGSGVIPTGDE